MNYLLKKIYLNKIDIYLFFIILYTLLKLFDLNKLKYNFINEF